MFGGIPSTKSARRSKGTPEGLEFQLRRRPSPGPTPTRHLCKRRLHKYRDTTIWRRWRRTRSSGAGTWDRSFERKDPYSFEFISLGPEARERDLEQASPLARIEPLVLSKTEPRRPRPAWREPRACPAPNAGRRRSIRDVERPSSLPKAGRGRARRRSSRVWTGKVAQFCRAKVAQFWVAPKSQTTAWDGASRAISRASR